MEIIDLSKNGFYPTCARTREFVSFLGYLDSKLNNPKRSFADLELVNEGAVLDEVASFARSAYVPALAERFLKDLSEFIQKLILIGKEQGFEWTPKDVLNFLFLDSGKDMKFLAKIVLAETYSKKFAKQITHEEVLLGENPNQIIDNLLKILGPDFVQYIGAGDSVLILSPLEAEYKASLEKMGLSIVGLPVNTISGEIEASGLEILKSQKDLKILILSDPNMGIGRILNENSLKYLANFAEEKDALIIADESFKEMFDSAVYMRELAPERTIFVDSGSFILCEKANKYISKIAHTAEFKSVQSQIFNIANLVLGEASKKAHKEKLQENADIFCKTLSLPHDGNLGSIIFDLNEIPGCNKHDLSLNEKLAEFEKQGLKLQSAEVLFSHEDRALRSKNNYVRACLGGMNTVKIEMSAKIIRDILSH